MPASTIPILWFAPASAFLHGTAGGIAATRLQACRLGVERIAAHWPNVIALDFNHDSPLTENRDNFWDPLHYRLPVARRLVADITAVVQGRPVADPALDILHDPRGVPDTDRQ